MYVFSAFLLYIWHFNRNRNFIESIPDMRRSQNERQIGEITDLTAHVSKCSMTPSKNSVGASVW